MCSTFLNSGSPVIMTASIFRAGVTTKQSANESGYRETWGQPLTGCCPNPLAIALGVMLPESSLVLMNVSHLRCGPVGVRFTRPPRLSPPQTDDGGQVEPAMTGVINAPQAHKCRPYKDLKRKFLYYQVIKLEVALLYKLALGNSLSKADPMFRRFIDCSIRSDDSKKQNG
jgi:hypothetical protein